MTYRTDDGVTYPSVSCALNARTYTLKDGSEWAFWALAPEFSHTGFATSQRRFFVWLWNAKMRRFLHAMVSPETSTVLRVKVDMPTIDAMRENGEITVGQTTTYGLEEAAAKVTDRMSTRR